MISMKNLRQGEKGGGRQMLYSLKKNDFIYSNAFEKINWYCTLLYIKIQIKIIKKYNVGA